MNDSRLTALTVYPYLILKMMSFAESHSMISFMIFLQAQKIAEVHVIYKLAV